MMRKLADRLLPFSGFEPALPLLPVELPAVDLPSPEGLAPKDASFRQRPDLAAGYAAQVMLPIVQPQPQSGNRIGRRG